MRNLVVFWVIFVLMGGAGTSSYILRGAPQPNSAEKEVGINLDSDAASEIDRILALRDAAPHASPEEVIDLVSRQFLGVPYVAEQLIGSATIPEQLVIDLHALDCSTYLDYVEALRHAQSRPDFVQRLIQTRYASGSASFLKRRHFFSDWAYRAPTLARDVTDEISPNAISVIKQLNEKGDGEQYIPGLPDIERKITYIPSQDIDDALLERLRTGDYIGIYASRPGIDVTHVGVYITTKNGPMLRNASFLKGNRKVVDSPFLNYVRSKPGIVVYRPR